jgi:hypothetical protein
VASASRLSPAALAVIIAITTIVRMNTFATHGTTTRRLTAAAITTIIAAITGTVPKGRSDSGRDTPSLMTRMMM